jgi:hypothetical protein
MFHVKPTNLDFVVDVRNSSNDARTNMIYRAYEDGKRLRVDSMGVTKAYLGDVLDCKHLAIDRKYL